MGSGVLLARDSAITINGVIRYRHPYLFISLLPSSLVYAVSKGFLLPGLTCVLTRWRKHKRHAYVVGSELKLNPANVTDGYIRSLVCGRMSSLFCVHGLVRGRASRQTMRFEMQC